MTASTFHVPARRTVAFLVILAIVAAATLRIIATFQQGLSADEWLTVSAISLDIPDLIRNRLAGGHSPFYFLLLKFVGLDGTSSDLALRLPSVLFDSLAAGILVWTASRIAGLYGAVAMLVFAVFTPAWIGHGQIARPYALLHLFLALTLAGATAALGAWEDRQKAKQAIAALIVGLIGAGYAHNIGLIAALLTPAAVLCVPSARRHREFLRLWFVAMAIVWLALLPNLVALAPTLRGFADYYWVETVNPFNLDSLWRVVVAVYGLTIPGPAHGFIEDHFQTVFALVIAGFAGLALLLARHRPPTTFIAFIAAALPLSLVAISAVQSLLLTRYFVSSLLAYLLLAADGAAIAARYIFGRLLLTATLAAVALQGIDTAFTPRNPDWRQATAFLDRVSFGVVRGIADTPIEKGLIERYAPAGLGIDLTLEPDAAKADGLLAAQLEREPFVWVFLGWRRSPFDLDLSAYVTCSWRFGQSGVMIVTKSRENLPQVLRPCRTESGSLATTLQRLLAAQ